MDTKTSIGGGSSDYRGKGNESIDSNNQHSSRGSENGRSDSSSSNGSRSEKVDSQTSSTSRDLADNLDK